MSKVVDLFPSSTSETPLHENEICAALAKMLGTSLEDFKNTWKGEVSEDRRQSGATLTAFHEYLTRRGAIKDNWFALGDNGVAFQIQAYLRELKRALKAQRPNAADQPRAAAGVTHG